MKSSGNFRLDWPSAALLIAVVFTVAVRLEATNWTPDLGYVESAAVLGTLLGLAVGLSNFKKSIRGLLLCLYTVFVVPFQVTRIITGEETEFGKLASLFGRFINSLDLLFTGKRIEDYIFFVTLMSILFWFVGFYSGYKLIRSRDIFEVMLPSMLPILIIQYYDGYKPDRIWGLAFYFFLALMMTGRINLLNSLDRWAEQNVVAGSDPEFDLNKNIVIVSAVIILIAWLMPVPAVIIPAAERAWQNINAPFNDVRKRFDDILAALNTGRTFSKSGDLYGDVLGLGRTAGSGAAELFNVRAPQNNLPRLYWRMRAYDYYQNGGWQNTNSHNVSFEPEKGSFVRTDVMSAPVGEFIFSWQTNQNALLATPSLPVWLSRTSSVQVNQSPGAETDPLSWSSTIILQKGDRYQVNALLANPTQKDLRGAIGTESINGVASENGYPVWIVERYLQVPNNISADYRHLSDQITSGLTNNYDKAEALTRYLRQNITYNESFPAPPPGIDPLIWFLFEKKIGFCNYYASADVLLLRSAGIPARMVVGFAQGKSTDNQLFSVRGQDAHAWPEAYFPTIGWVQFEPTSNQPDLVRPSGQGIISTDGTSNSRPDGNGFNNNSRKLREDEDPLTGVSVPLAVFLGLTAEQWMWIGFTITILILSSALIWRLYLRNHPLQSLANRIPHAIKAFLTFYHLNTPVWVDRWVRWSEVSPAERAFHAVNQSLSWLKQAQPGFVTPAERASLLKVLLPEAALEIDILARSLEVELFTNHSEDIVPVIQRQTNRSLQASWMLRFVTIKKIIRKRIFGE